MTMQLNLEEKIYPAAKLAGVAEALFEEGIPHADVLRGLGVPPEDLHSPQTRVSLNQLIDGYRRALVLSSDPHLAYRIGSKVHVSAYGLYGYAMLCSTDFRRSMDFARGYHQLAAPLAEIGFAEHDGSAAWTIDPLLHPRMDSRLYRFLTELQIGIHVSLHRDLMGTEFAPSEVTVTYSPLEGARGLADLIGCPVSFERSDNRIVFDSAWLDRTPKFGNRTTYAHLISLCRELLADMTLRSGIAGKVRGIILQDIANPPTFAGIARLMELPPRTLRRRLQLQDTSFRQLLDELRCHVAMKYLRDTAMTHEDIAFALGFSDAANFRHAFRRWSSMTPHDFRATTERTRGSTSW